MAIRRAVAFGDLLRQYRRRAGLTQEQLAERAGLSVRGISDLERGVNLAPYRSTVTHLVEALDLHGPDRAALEQMSSRYGTPGAAPPTGETALGEPASRTPLVGRERELAILQRHMRGELPPLLAIAGEPGIGKTRVLRAARDLAIDLQLPALHAGCQRVAGEQPYAPLGDALSAYVHGLPATQVRSALKACGWLVRLLPELSETVGTPQMVGDLAPDAERRLLTGAVTRFLQNIAGPRGVLLVLDDLQWAGCDGLELLLALCRSAHETGVRIVCAYRATEVSPEDPLSTLLADAAHAGLVHRIALAPLSAAESGELIDALAPQELSPGIREQVLAHSGGVPFFLVSCASALHMADTGEEAIPWTVMQSVRQRVAVQSDVAQDVLAVAATVGRVVPTGVIMEVLDHPPPVIATALDALCRAGLLAEHDLRSYAFTHDVIREVVEADLGSARQMHLHLAVAEALERASGAPEGRQAAELAWHFCQGDDAARALPYALLAGDHAASLYAHRDAAELYGAAAGHAASIGDGRTEAEASERAGRELTSVADYTTAVTFLDRAAALYRSMGDVEAEARVVAQLGWTHFYRATPNAAVARVETLVELLQDRPPSESLARLYLTLTFLWYAHRPHEALDGAARACCIARELGDDSLLAVAQVRHGLMLGRVGRWDEGERVLREAAALAERVGDIESQAHALGFAGIACGMQGKLQESRACYERGTDIAERFGDPMAVVYGLHACGGACSALGDWEAARAYLERARAVDAASPSTFSALIPLSMLGLAVSQGRWEEADVLAAECLVLRHDQRNDRIDTNLLCLLAEKDLLQGRPRDAYARLEPRLDGFYADEVTNLGARTTLIEVCVAVGDLHRAQTLLSQYADLLTQQGNHRAKPALLRARATVHAAEDRLHEADELLSEAAQLASQMHYMPEHARILLEWTRVTQAMGNTIRAEALAHEAASIFQRLGAAPYAAQARQQLLELRQHPIA